MTDLYAPRPEDRFSIGIWTVGWQAVDVLGPATRAPMPAERAVRKLAAGNTRGAFWVVDLVDGSEYEGPIHFDFKPPRVEDDDGVWESARACMRNWLTLREKVRAFRADPEVADALRSAGRRARPTRPRTPLRRAVAVAPRLERCPSRRNHPENSRRPS